MPMAIKTWCQLCQAKSCTLLHTAWTPILTPFFRFQKLFAIIFLLFALIALSAAIPKRGGGGGRGGGRRGPKFDCFDSDDKPTCTCDDGSDCTGRENRDACDKDEKTFSCEEGTLCYKGRNEVDGVESCRDLEDADDE